MRAAPVVPRQDDSCFGHLTILCLFLLACSLSRSLLVLLIGSFVRASQHHCPFFCKWRPAPFRPRRSFSQTNQAAAETLTVSSAQLLQREVVLLCTYTDDLRTTCPQHIYEVNLIKLVLSIYPVCFCTDLTVLKVSGVYTVTRRVHKFQLQLDITASIHLETHKDWGLMTISFTLTQCLPVGNMSGTPTSSSEKSNPASDFSFWLGVSSLNLHTNITVHFFKDLQGRRTVSPLETATGSRLYNVLVCWISTLQTNK